MYREIIQDSIDYIEDNLKTELSAQELSDRAGFSLFHYYRVFQTAVGLPVMQYVLRLRLLNAIYEISLGGKMCALFPWVGSYAFLAMERFLKIRCGQRLGLKGLETSRPYYMQFTMQVGESAFYEIVCEEAEVDFDPMELVYPKEVPVFEKYDTFVAEELVRKGFAYGVLDTAGMKQRILSWSRFIR